MLYLSKYFGWNNDYIFTLHEHGHYSINLSQNYHDNNLFSDYSHEIFNFDFENFFEFIKESSIDFLEATSTLLYVFKNNPENFNKKNSIDLLNKLKPYISLEIKLNAYFKVNNFDLINKLNKNVSNSEINDIKSNLANKIISIQDNVESLEPCRNYVLTLGSLEYMDVILRIEHLKKGYEMDLFDFMKVYISKIEYLLKDLSDFENLDLSIVEELFEQFQNYVSNELKIIPRVDDDNFSYKNYY